MPTVKENDSQRGMKEREKLTRYNSRLAGGYTHWVSDQKVATFCSIVKSQLRAIQCKTCFTSVIL